MMKSFLIAFTVALFFTSALQAQHINIGIKGGLNLYNLTYENSSSGEPIGGFHLGLIGHVHLNDQFALQPEVVFSTQGARFSNSGVQSQLNLNYVNLPLLLQYMFDNGFRLYAGPQAGFLLSAKTSLDNSEFDRNNDFESIELGVSFGLSYINPNSNFGIDARFNRGLTDINEDSSETSYNRGLQLGAFYLFGHK